MAMVASVDFLLVGHGVVDAFRGASTSSTYEKQINSVICSAALLRGWMLLRGFASGVRWRLQGLHTGIHKIICHTRIS